jgi:AcrR family transcriptional regulator
MAVRESRPRLSRGDLSRARLRQAAAEELVAREGVLEVESVAQRAEVSVGLIYRHFGSRAGLIQAVMEDFYGRYRDEVLGTNPFPGGTWAERERRRTALGVSFHYQEPLARVILSHLHLDAQIAVYEAAQLDDMIMRCAGLVLLGQKRGELPKDRDPSLAGAMIIGGIRRTLATVLTQQRLPRESDVVHDLWLFVAGVVGIDPRQP